MNFDNLKNKLFIFTIYELKKAYENEIDILQENDENKTKIEHLESKIEALDDLDQLIKLEA